MTPLAGSRHTEMRPKITPGIVGRLEQQGLQANRAAAEAKNFSHCYQEGPERPLFTALESIALTRYRLSATSVRCAGGPAGTASRFPHHTARTRLPRKAKLSLTHTGGITGALLTKCFFQKQQTPA